MDDPDWREENAQIISQKIKTLYHFIKEIQLNLKSFEIQSIDDWIESRIQRKINKITEAICNLETRTASELAFFEIWNDLKWYLRRTNQQGSKILKKQPLSRRIASRIFNILVRLILNLQYTDTQCGSKVFRRQAILKILPKIKNKGWAFDVGILFLLKKHNYKVKSINPSLDSQRPEAVL